MLLVQAHGRHLPLLLFARLAGQLVPGIKGSPSQHQHKRWQLLHDFLQAFWGSELRSSLLAQQELFQLSHFSVATNNMNFNDVLECPLCIHWI